ncbi:hypothetical protein [Paraburkholderia sp. BR14374]
MWGSDWPHTQFEADEDFTHALELLRALLPVEGKRLGRAGPRFARAWGMM